MGTRTSVAAVIQEALEHYLAGAAGTEALRLAHAFLVGVGVGLELRPATRKLSTGSTSATPVGFVVPPLEPPPNYTQGLCKDPESGSVSGPSLVGSDLRSTARANFGHAETLALFPPDRAAPAPKATARNPHRATAWPDDFRLTAERIENAKRVGADPAWEWDKFRDYHHAKGSRFVDWNAAWRTWLRNAVDFDLRRAR